MASNNIFFGADLNWSGYISGSAHNLDHFLNTSSWDGLDNRACIKAYCQGFLSTHGDVLVITSVNVSVPVTYVASSTTFAADISYDWKCSQDKCNINALLVNSSYWTILGQGETEYPVQYCFNEPVEEHCRVQFSIAVMSVVIACKFLKASCMVLTLRLLKSQPIVTLGDGIDSFLKKKDAFTEDMCLSGKSGFSQDKWGKDPIVCKGQRYGWFSSASIKWWLTCNVL